MILMIDDNSNNNEKNIAHDTSNNSYNYDIQMCPNDCVFLDTSTCKIMLTQVWTTQTFYGR